MDDEQKAIEDIKGQDMSAAQKARASVPKKTWFFERGDGRLIVCEEQEAWDIVNNRSEWKRHDFKMIGVSDGTTYQRIVKESMTQATLLQPQITKAEEEIQKFRRAEDRLIVNEVVDMDDHDDPANEANVQKVLRMRRIIEKLEDKLDALNEEYRSKVSDVVKRATEAELEAARGHIEWPVGANIMTPNASAQERNKILRAMGQI
jgi:hypothetical protein